MDGICIPPLREEILAWGIYLIILIGFTVVNGVMFVRTRAYHNAAETTHKTMGAIIKAAANRKRNLGAMRK